MITTRGPLGTATFSDCMTYRYELTRDLQPVDSEIDPTAYINFVMLNPSTATAEKNDPTVAKCCRWATEWGYRKLVVTNLFALRSKDPKDLYAAQDPIGPENDYHIIETAKGAHKLIAAWGAHGRYAGRSIWFRSMVGAVPIYVLRLGSKEPYHPLYLPNATVPFEWENEWYAGNIGRNRGRGRGAAEDKTREAAAPSKVEDAEVRGVRRRFR